MTSYSVLGRPAARPEGPEKVTGTARYTADMTLPGMLWGKALHSPYPHARIVRIDTSRALGLPGVHAVLTGADVAGVLYGSRIRDVPVLAQDRARFAGDRVAAVAAEDPDIARQAVDLIDVEYEELPAVFDSLEAMEEGASLLHPGLLDYEGLPQPGGFVPAHGHVEPLEGASNVFARVRWGTGDVAEGFAQAEVTVENTFTTPSVHQVYLEPHCCLVWVDGEERVQVWAPNKTPYNLREALAAALGIPQERVRLHPTHIGGDFGGKGSPMEVPLCYFLARRTGRPVKMVMDYGEELTAANPRHGAVLRLTTGLKRDGTIVAHSTQSILNSGAYGGFMPMGYLPGCYHAAAVYRIPHAQSEALHVYTNTVPCGHMRGPGEAQVVYAVEAHMDCVARRLGMDPVEFRMKNLVREGDTGAAGERYEHVRSVETLEAAVKASGYGTPKPANVGRGVAVGDRTPGGGHTHAALTLSPDGSVVLNTSIFDQGSGTYTVLRQIVAEELGLPPEGVQVQVWDTDAVDFDTGMGGCRVTRVGSQAAHQATVEARQELLAAAAELLGWPSEQVELAQGRVRRKDDDEGLPLADLLGRIARPIIGRATVRDFAPSPVTSFAAQVAEVSVDRETGQVTLLRFTSAHDVGRVLNPLGHQGQIEGGVVQGVGYALMEELRSEEGRVTSTSFGEYKVPTVRDVPELKTVLLESESGVGPYHIKGIGENPISPVAPAIANAVEDAVGVRIRDLPITAEKVYRALHPGRALHP